MITPLDELENVLKQLHVYIGIPVSIPEKIVAERLYDKALQKLEQTRIQQQQQVMKKLEILEDKLDAISDVSSTTLFEVQAKSGATLARHS